MPPIPDHPDGHPSGLRPPPARLSPSLHLPRLGSFGTTASPPTRLHGSGNLGMLEWPYVARRRCVCAKRTQFRRCRRHLARACRGPEALDPMAGGPFFPSGAGVPVDFRASNRFACICATLATMIPSESPIYQLRFAICRPLGRNGSYTIRRRWVPFCSHNFPNIFDRLPPCHAGCRGRQSCLATPEAGSRQPCVSARCLSCTSAWDQPGSSVCGRN